MVTTNRCLAIVPARKGSKRVPNKNTRQLAGKPLVQYSIEHGIEASLVDEVVVSTDDIKICQLAETLGATVHKREASLASDSALSIDVVRDVLHGMAGVGRRFDLAVLLQPTSPFRQPGKVDEAISLLVEEECDSVVSVVNVDHFHPNRMKRIVNERLVPYCEDELMNTAFCDLPQAFHRDGAIYAMRTQLPLEHNLLVGNDTAAVVSASSSFVNIDTERDWLIAESMARALG